MRIVVLVIGLSTTVALAQEPQTPTLLELARAQGGRAEVTGLASGFVGERPSFENIVRDADVIVHGRVIEVRGRLSANARRVWTDYHVEPIEVVRQGSALSTPIVFMAEGGHVEVEGLTLIEHFSHNRLRVALKGGDEVILAGSVQAGGLWVSPFSVFMVRDGQVRSNGPLPGFGNDDQTAPLSVVLQRVRELVP